MALESVAWYCRLDGKVAGPLSLDEIRFLIARKKLSRSDIVRPANSVRWQTAGQITDLFPSDGTAVTRGTDRRGPQQPVVAADSGGHVNAETDVESPPSQRPPLPVRDQPDRAREIVMGVGAASSIFVLLLLLLLLLRPATSAKPGQGPDTASAGGRSASDGSADTPAADKTPNDRSAVENTAEAQASSPSAEKPGGTETADSKDADSIDQTATAEERGPDDDEAKTTQPNERSTIQNLGQGEAREGSDVGSDWLGGRGTRGGDAAGRSGSRGGSERWGSMIKRLQRHGLDIVICFDSTGSMAGEINAVKDQIRRIGVALHELVPKARIGICTYRDVGDAYLVRGLPLTNNIEEITKYLSTVSAGGGGDHPEAVEEGLKWTLETNDFRRRARKVILVFGDAPPHNHHLELCKQLATGFRNDQKGVVSTVTCRGSQPMPAFVEIAEFGGGEAFTTRNERELVTQLVVLVFGSKYREMVVKAFKLMES